MPQTLVELGGAAAASILHIAPANGFPPQTYLPLLRRLPGFRALCLPPRALWGGAALPAEYQDWSAAATDLLAGFAAHNLSGITAIGHSFGGIVSLLALLKEPARFKALILLDPVFLPPRLLALNRQAWAEGKVEDMPLVRGTRRRRQFFASREAAFARFRQRPLFADWADETLWLYVQHGLRPRAAGSAAAGFELAWSADWEAYYFATVYRQIWQDLPKLNGLAQTLIIRAPGSDTFPDAVLERAQSLLPAVDFHELPGQGHLFPQAAPIETAQIILRWLGKEF